MSRVRGRVVACGVGVGFSWVIGFLWGLALIVLLVGVSYL